MRRALVKIVGGDEKPLAQATMHDREATNGTASAAVAS